MTSVVLSEINTKTGAPQAVTCASRQGPSDSLSQNASTPEDGEEEEHGDKRWRSRPKSGAPIPNIGYTKHPTESSWKKSDVKAQNPNLTPQVVDHFPRKPSDAVQLAAPVTDLQDVRGFPGLLEISGDAFEQGYWCSAALDLPVRGVHRTSWLTGHRAHTSTRSLLHRAGTIIFATPRFASRWPPVTRRHAPLLECVIPPLACC